MPDDWVCQPIPLIIPSRRQKAQLKQQSAPNHGSNSQNTSSIGMGIGMGNLSKNAQQRFAQIKRAQAQPHHHATPPQQPTQSFRPPPPNGKAPHLPTHKPPPPPKKPNIQIGPGIGAAAGSIFNKHKQSPSQSRSQSANQSRKNSETATNSPNNNNNNNNNSSNTYFSKSESSLGSGFCNSDISSDMMSMNDNNKDTSHLRGAFAWTDSVLASEDRSFLQSCNLVPFFAHDSGNNKNEKRKKYTHITIGDRFIYELDSDDVQANSPRKHGHAQINGKRHSVASKDGTKIGKLTHKPLVMAVLTEFTFGSVFPDMGCSVWRTKIGKQRAEQFFSIQVRDMDILADTDLKLQIQNKIKTGFEQAVTQLQKETEKEQRQEKEKEKLDAILKAKEKEKQNEKNKEGNDDTSVTTKTTKTTSGTTPKSNATTPGKTTTTTTATATASSEGTTPQQSEQSKQSRRKGSSHRHRHREKRERDRTMTLLISSRHYKAQTFASDFIFDVAHPFPGYTSETMSVFNFQWTRRLPAPETILGSISDMHVKPISIYLDPFLCYNVVSFYIGKGVLKCYQIQAALTTMFTNLANENIIQRFVTRYQLDALKIKVPLNEVKFVFFFLCFLILFNFVCNEK